MTRREALAVVAAGPLQLAAPEIRSESPRRFQIMLQRTHALGQGYGDLFTTIWAADRSRRIGIKAFPDLPCVSFVGSVVTDGPLSGGGDPYAKKRRHNVRFQEPTEVLHACAAEQWGREGHGLGALRDARLHMADEVNKLLVERFGAGFTGAYRWTYDDGLGYVIAA